MNPTQVFEFVLAIHSEPFMWMAAFITGFFVMALLFALLIQVLRGGIYL